MAVVEVMNNGYSRDKLLMILTIDVYFYIKVQVEAVHCPGKDNIRADALSWNDIDRFLQALPGADQKAADIPHHLLPLIVDKQPNRMSTGCSQPLSSRFSLVHIKNICSRKRRYMDL